MKKEQKQSNFNKIAHRRKDQIKDKIISLLNLKNTNFYDYEKNDIKLIFKDIETTLQETKKTLLSDKKNNRFKLSKDIKIKIDEEDAKKLSIIINELFINNFFDVSNELESIYSFDDLLAIKNQMINLKAIIDIELDKNY